MHIFQIQGHSISIPASITFEEADRLARAIYTLPRSVSSVAIFTTVTAALTAVGGIDGGWPRVELLPSAGGWQVRYTSESGRFLFLHDDGFIK